MSTVLMIGCPCMTWSDAHSYTNQISVWNNHNPRHGPEGLVRGNDRTKTLLNKNVVYRLPFEFGELGESISSLSEESRSTCTHVYVCSYSDKTWGTCKTFMPTPNFVSRMECKGHMLFASYHALKYDSIARYFGLSLVFRSVLYVLPQSVFASLSPLSLSFRFASVSSFVMYELCVFFTVYLLFCSLVLFPLSAKIEKEHTEAHRIHMMMLQF